MSNVQFDKETIAYAALNRVLEEARQARDLFQEAELPLPTPLIRLFGNGKPAKEESNQGVSVKPLSAPPAPPEATEDWLWVPTRDSLPMTLVPAILKENGAPMQPKEITERIMKMRPNLTRGGIYNVGPRLKTARMIEQTGEGWALIRDAKSPILYRDNVWGLPEMLQKHELAAHRRAIIVHLLAMYPTGLQILQIVEQLTAFKQCKAPVNKDLVKADMQVMQKERKAKRTSSRKWVAIKEE